MKKLGWLGRAKLRWALEKVERRLRVVGRAATRPSPL